MLGFLIHCMEACVVLLSCVVIYRVKNLTDKYYQLELAGEAQLQDSESISLDYQKNEDNILRKLLRAGTAKSNQHYDSKIRTLQQSQLFASSQLLKIKREFGDLNNNTLSWLQEASAFYLVGAISQIAKHENCHADDIEEITLLTLKSSLNISKEESYQHHYKALRTTDNLDLNSTIRAGEDAANEWLNGKVVSNKLTLTNQLENWGVIA